MCVCLCLRVCLCLCLLRVIAATHTYHVCVCVCGVFTALYSTYSSTFLKTSCPPHTVACSVVTFLRYFVRNLSKV